MERERKSARREENQMSFLWLLLLMGLSFMLLLLLFLWCIFSFHWSIQATRSTKKPSFQIFPGTLVYLTTDTPANVSYNGASSETDWFKSEARNSVTLCDSVSYGEHIWSQEQERARVRFEKMRIFFYCLLLRRIQQNICLFQLFDWVCVRSVFPTGLSGAAPFCFVSVIVMNVTNRRNVKEFLSDNRYYKDTVV